MDQGGSVDVIRHDLWVKSGELAMEFTGSLSFTHAQHRGRITALINTGNRICNLFISVISSDITSCLLSFAVSQQVWGESGNDSFHCGGERVRNVQSLKCLNICDVS